MSSTVQLSGGAFQTPQGNVLANGYLLMVLSQDASTSDGKQITAGYTVKIVLDANGNVQSSPAQNIWANDALTPANTFYNVSGYTSSGELVWGPNSQLVLSTPSPYDIGAWINGSVNVSSGVVTTYDIACFVPSQYAASQVFLYLKLERAVRFLFNFLPSTAACGTNPTSPFAATVQQNGTTVATINVSTSGVGSISSNGVTFNAGDVLEIVGPSSIDATLSNLGIILSGTTAV